uniref:DUF4218 domain-containing protein n=1 Tax=Tanacetum cinerariifolium TaxID=118510 RepID=A0A6L2M634_TANCI|nr:hypothetical protein [Tanacetum cinerariifolium]
MRHEFDLGYKTWVHYGEPDLPPPSPLINNTRQPQMSDMTALLNDLSYIPPNNKHNEMSNEPTQATRNEFKELYASANEELYPEFFQNVFPISKGYKLPPSYYAIKKTFKTIGLGYESIHACEHDCSLFREDDNKELDFCLVCNTSRWKDSNTPGKKVPKKVLRYFSIIPRLQRLYKSSHTSKVMIWHATVKCTDPGYKACPTCNEDTPSVRVLSKTAYVGHRRFLKKPHKRRSSREFNGQTDNRDPPKEFSQDEILAQLDRLPTRLMGKHPSYGDVKIKCNQICSATLMENDMLKAQIKVVDILCDLELIYPPALFDIMIHLLIHLPLKALEGGSIRPRWVFPFERYMKKLKGYVRNKAKPKGSIAEGYVAEEALTFSSHYFWDVTTKFNCPNRNVDLRPPTCQFQIRQRHVDNDKDPEVSTTSELFALACGPTWTPISINSCVVDGVRYVVHSRDERCTTQNSGICSPGPDGEMYYEGVIVVEDDPDIIHFDNSSDLPFDVVDEDDDMIDDEDALPHDLADFDVEDLIIVDDDDVARSHDDDGGGKGKRKPNLGGRAAGRLHTRGKTRNLSLKEITDKRGPVLIRFKVHDKQTLMPPGDHAAHWSSYIGEVIRGVLLYYPSWLKVSKEWKAALITDFETQFNLRPHMESPDWTEIDAGIQQHLQKAYNTNKAAFKSKHWVIDTQTGTYNVDKIRRARPEAVTTEEWDKYIQFWNDPRNITRAAQNRQNRAKSTVISQQGSRSLARLRDEMSSATQEYPSMIDTFFVTHTVNGVFTRDEDCFIYEEMRRLEATGIYTDDEINRLARRGKQRGHIPCIGRVLPARVTAGPSRPASESTLKSLHKKVDFMISLFKSDSKFSDAFSQFESANASGSGGSGGCKDDEESADDQEDEDEDGDGDS